MIVYMKEISKIRSDMEMAYILRQPEKSTRALSSMILFMGKANTFSLMEAYTKVLLAKITFLGMESTPSSTATSLKVNGKTTL